jgi:hypothetical protein
MACRTFSRETKHAGHLQRKQDVERHDSYSSEDADATSYASLEKYFVAVKRSVIERLRRLEKAWQSIGNLVSSCCRNGEIGNFTCWALGLLWSGVHFRKELVQ